MFSPECAGPQDPRTLTGRFRGLTSLAKAHSLRSPLRLSLPGRSPFGRPPGSLPLEALLTLGSGPGVVYGPSSLVVAPCPNPLTRLPLPALRKRSHLQILQSPRCRRLPPAPVPRIGSPLGWCRLEVISRRLPAGGRHRNWRGLAAGAARVGDVPAPRQPPRASASRHRRTWARESS